MITEESEGARLAQAIGGRKAAILRNHGLNKLKSSPGFAGVGASVMLPCQEGESPSDVKS
jgi:hypothetical protein